MSRPTIEELQSAADYLNAHATLEDLTANLTMSNLTTGKVEATAREIEAVLKTIKANAANSIKVSETRSEANCQWCEGSGLFLNAADWFQVCQCRQKT